LAVAVLGGGGGIKRVVAVVEGVGLRGGRVSMGVVVVGCAVGGRVQLGWDGRCRSMAGRAGVMAVACGVDGSAGGGASV